MNYLLGFVNEQLSGTEYFISTRFMDVCSKQLRLTDEIVNIDDAVLSK